MSDTREVPFYDRDGDHWITLQMDVDEHGAPPEMVELAGSQQGRAMQRQFRREVRPESDPPWAYVEVTRTWRGEPVPGSPDALRRIMDSHEWPH